MPYFSIQTNQPIAETTVTDLGKKASAFIADLVGKPEAYVMTAIKTETAMTFAGRAAPTAFVELKSLGLTEDQCNPFAEKISAFIQTELGIEPNRVFIDFAEAPRTRFAWNGKTFA
jgi:phenylpyruvate tautomerase PptA (4-oxalocrotonate tautomerase family)